MAVPDGEGVYLCEHIASPFVFGIVKPKIYLPFGLEDDQRQWVLLHERSHISRRDFLLKPLFWLAVVVHWMNPLVWVAWHFYSRDVELACDERAVGQLNDNQKWCYSNTLLQLAVQTPKWSCPVAFGNNSVKQRIRHVLCYKQAAMGVAAVALAVIVMMMAALGVNPVQVYAMGDLRPEVYTAITDIDHATVRWGSAIVEVTDKAQLAQLQQALAAVQVKKQGRDYRHGNMFNEYEAYLVPTVNVVQFETADGQLISRFAFNGDCSQLEPLDQDTERCAYLAVQQPEEILAVFAQYGAEARAQLTDTLFLADLDHDGIQESIVVNPTLWEQEGTALLAVYQDDGAVLYSADLNRAHVGWGNYFLYHRDGEAYLLQYTPYMGQGYATYNWQLLQFDKNGQPEVVEEDSVEFTVNPEQYQFDVQAIYAYCLRLDELLQQSTLLVSTEDGALQYSTADKAVTLSAEDYLDWLNEPADGQSNNGALLEKLQREQSSLYFSRPQARLEQWLQENKGFDAAQQQLTAAALQDIDGVRCVSFELHWREDTPMQGRLIGIYAVSTQDVDNGIAAQQGRSYYQYNQADDTWVLLANDGQQEDLAQLADQWAQSWADRDGSKRYARMSEALRKPVDQATDWENADDWEDWMPMWVTDDDGSKNMFLRGSSPWVESWQVTLQMPELSPAGQPVTPYLAIITYDMMDSGQQHYVYEETLQCEQKGEVWQVTDCTVTVDYLSPQLYEAAQTISQAVADGHDSWRLDAEQVAMAFGQDYLEVDGSVSDWDQATQSLVYQGTDGVDYRLFLYHPILHIAQPALDFWAVSGYEYKERQSPDEYTIRHHDVLNDLWASLHVAQ